jgi:hypothetical protein
MILPMIDITTPMFREICKCAIEVGVTLLVFILLSKIFDRIYEKRMESIIRGKSK